MDYKDILKEIEMHAETEGELPIIGPVKGAFLGEMVKKYQPKRILEIGTLVGYSSIIMAVNLPDGGKIVSVEVNPSQAEKALVNISNAGLAGKIEVKVGRAKDVVPALAEKFDMLFIDGEMKDYLAYLEIAEPKLSPHAIVVADNAGKFAYKMQGFLEYVRNGEKYESQTFDFDGDAVELSIRK